MSLKAPFDFCWEVLRASHENPLRQGWGSLPEEPLWLGEGRRGNGGQKRTSRKFYIVMEHAPFIPLQYFGLSFEFHTLSYTHTKK